MNFILHEERFSAILLGDERINEAKNIVYIYTHTSAERYTLHMTDNLVPVFTYACIARRSDGRHVLALKLSDKCKVLLLHNYFHIPLIEECDHYKMDLREPLFGRHAGPHHSRTKKRKKKKSPSIHILLI